MCSRILCTISLMIATSWAKPTGLLHGVQVIPPSGVSQQSRHDIISPGVISYSTAHAVPVVAAAPVVSISAHTVPIPAVRVASASSVRTDSSYGGGIGIGGSSLNGIGSLGAAGVGGLGANGLGGLGANGLGGLGAAGIGGLGASGLGAVGISGGYGAGLGANSGISVGAGLGIANGLGGYGASIGNAGYGRLY